jgi:hypothetical protein
MDDSLHIEDLLVSYLDGKLGETERRELEERLRTDEDLQEQLASLRVAIQAIRQYGTRQKVNSLHKEMMEELTMKPKDKVISINKTVRYAMAVAASVILLFIAVKLYMAAQVSPEKVYSEVFVSFNTSSTRGGNEDISVIEKAYQQKDYKAVIQQIRPLQINTKDSLLIGLSYLQTDHANQAILFFRQLAGSDNEYRQDAEFYLSLSYLKNKEYAKAFKVMKTIAANPSHIYRERLTKNTLERVEALID